MTRGELIAELAASLGARHEARFIVEEVLGSLALGSAQVVAPADLADRPHAGGAPARGEPLQYVLGHWAFRSLDLLVDPRVLIRGRKPSRWSKCPGRVPPSGAMRPPSSTPGPARVPSHSPRHRNGRSLCGGVSGPPTPARGTLAVARANLDAGPRTTGAQGAAGQPSWRGRGWTRSRQGCGRQSIWSSPTRPTSPPEEWPASRRGAGVSPRRPGGGRRHRRHPGLADVEPVLGAGVDLAGQARCRRDRNGAAPRPMR